MVRERKNYAECREPKKGVVQRVAEVVGRCASGSWHSWISGELDKKSDLRRQASCPAIGGCEAECYILRMSTAGNLRYALRMMRRSPGFTAVAVVSLALGIGVNTAIFSLVDQLLLWSIPAREVHRLVKLEGGYSNAYPFYCAYRDLNQVFSGVFASSFNLPTGIRPEGAPVVEVGHVQYVSGGYFQTLGIGSAAGRVIAPSDDTTPGGSPIAVLSYSYWRRRFAGDLKVIGGKLAVNGYPLEIVGIAEKGFGGLFNGQEPDAFIPLTMFPATTPSTARVWNTAHMFWLTTMARLKRGMRGA